MLHLCESVAHTHYTIMTHHLNILAGQEYRMPVRLVDAAGHAVPIADYDLYGAARRGSETTRMSVAVVDGSSCVAIIPPLEQASYTYDLYLRHRLTTAEVQILAGNIAVRGRVASMPPATGGGEDVVAVVSADMTEVQVTVTPIAVATPDAWDRLDRAGDLLAEAIETAGALVPDAQRVIRKEVETGQSAITEAAADATRQAGAGIASAGDREVARAADRIRAVSGEEADAIASAGAAARQAVAAAGSSATSEALAAIDAAVDGGKGAINSSVNSGVNAIGQAVTAGTGTISDATASGKSSIDTYVSATQADLARKSQANIWSGVQTVNAPLVANGGIILQPTSSATSVGTHMSAWLWGSTYCTERAIPYNGTWTLRDDRGLRGEYETVLYSAISSSSYSMHTTTFSRFDISFLVSERNYNTAQIKRQVVGIDVQRGSSYAARSGKYPWDWCADREVRIIASPHHAVRCIQIRQAIVTNPAGLMGWRMIYPRGIDDLLSIQIISRGSEWHDPVYAMMYADDILGIEALFQPVTHPDVTANLMTSSILQSAGIIGCHAYANMRSQTFHPTPPSVTTYKHALPHQDWTRPKVWPEEQAIRAAVNKTWVDWRYIVASLDYTPAQAERALLSTTTNIGRHVYVTAGAQDIGLAASVYRPKSGGGTLLPDGVVVDIDTASSWLTHSDGALHLAANASGAERIASVWLYSDQGVGTIYEIQIHQSAS